MKFNNYLNEVDMQYMGPELKLVLSKVPKSFLKAFYLSKEFLYRGMKYKIRGYSEFTRPEYREPKDSPKTFHKIWDLAFEGIFGWKARSLGTFTTANPSTASAYGEKYVYFPLDQNYKFIYSWTIHDLTNDFLNEFSDTSMHKFANAGLDYRIFKNTNSNWPMSEVSEYIDSLDSLKYRLLTEIIKDFFREVYIQSNQMTDMLMKKFASSGNEVTFLSEKYLLVNIGPNVFYKWLIDTIGEILGE